MELILVRPLSTSFHSAKIDSFVSQDITGNRNGTINEVFERNSNKWYYPTWRLEEVELIHSILVIFLQESVICNSIILHNPSIFKVSSLVVGGVKYC